MTNGIENLDRKRSVTRTDQDDASSGVWVWNILDGRGTMPSPASQLPTYWTPERDYMLTSTLDLEDMWSAAVAKAITKVSARGFEVADSDSARRTESGQRLIMNFDGLLAYHSGIERCAQDFLLTDLGAFIEVERASSAPFAKPRTLWTLDSFRVRPTRDQQYPFIYIDRAGVIHKMRYDSIIHLVDMPSPRATKPGIGRCAASRAFQTIIKLSAVETYFREKITGARGLALSFVRGVTRTQLDNALLSSDEAQARKGHVVYKGVVMVPIPGEGAVEIATIDLAGVPDGFDVEQERRDAYLRYANALGVPVQDIQPLSGQGLGTGTQTVVLSEAAEGQGPIISFMKKLEMAISFLVLPKTTTFQIKTNDVRDQKAQAELEKLRAETRAARIQSGEITVAMAQQLALDAGDLPKELAPPDLTPEGTLTDSGPASKNPEEPPEANARQALLRLSGLGTKEYIKDDTDVDALIDDELEKALDMIRGLAK